MTLSWATIVSVTMRTRRKVHFWKTYTLTLAWSLLIFLRSTCVLRAGGDFATAVAREIAATAAYVDTLLL
jgi:hypothetical protein